MPCPYRKMADKFRLIIGFMLIFLLAARETGYGQEPVALPQWGNAYTPLGSNSYHLIDRIDISYSSTYRDLHTAIKPYLREDIADLTLNYAKSDSFNRREHFNINYLCADNGEFATPKGSEYYRAAPIPFFFPEPATLYQFFTVRVNPVIANSFGTSIDSGGLNFVNTRGLELRGSIDNKVGFYLYATDNQAIFPGYIKDRIDAAPQVVPGEGVAKIFKEDGFDWLSTHGYVAFNATKHIAMQFGQDKLFVGDGIRSLIWSSNAKDMLFFKINTKIWRANYENIFTELANYDGSNIYNSLVHKKYAAMHHLNFPITKNLHFGLFETIIFDRTTYSGGDKGFEYNYLNPVIFYRAVESGLGSSDNVVLGANWKWNFLNQFSFYGQFVLDELVVSEFIANDGWWGNKYALQSGLKYINVFGINQLDLQYEFNMARPYTYSYEDENGSSYTHYAQPLAHPLGANFKENLIALWYQPAPKFTITNTLMLANYGTDSLNTNYGGNVFLDYNNYANEYGNTIGQGIHNNLLVNDLVISWQFWHNANLDFRCIYRKPDSEENTNDTNSLYFSIGVRLNEVLKQYLF